MRKMLKFLALALFGLLLAGSMVACGDATATFVPAAKPTEAAMAKAQPTADATATAKLTEVAMAMVKPTEVPMMKPTAEAMAKPIEAAMAKPTAEAMAKPTEAAMAKPNGPLSGDFNNQGAEPVAGKATLGKTSEGKLVLRFENLKSAPGPDLFVYLTKAESPSTNDQIKMGLEVGKLKATQGSLNYELDSSLDLSQYKAVVVYCKSFSVVFGYANLKAAVS